MTLILYVEDNDDNIYMLSNRLQRKGYEVVVARDGKEAIESAARELPNLIILDLVLPEIDGWEAARRLKADPGTSHIPIIALSANAMSGDDTRAFDAGCDEFDTKPVNFPRLLSKISRLLN